MHAVRRGIAAVTMALTLVGQARAQSGRELVVRVAGGGISALAAVAPAGTYTTKAGAAFGGDLGFRLVPHVFLMADVQHGSTAVSFQGAPLGVDITRTFTSALLEFPIQLGAWSPYLLAGGGALFLNQHTGADPKQTLGAALAGMGLGYSLGRTPASLFLEGRMYLHEPKGLVGNAAGEARVQWDGTLGAGVSYAFGHRG